MKMIMIQWLSIVGLMFGATLSVAQEDQSIKLPQPQVKTGVPLMQALHDKAALANAMKLNSTQWIVAAQSVGFPKK